jgi:hypothetical protein
LQPYRAVHLRQRGSYAGRRPKTFRTALGEMTIERAYYHCPTCQTVFCPRDRALGLQHTSLSAVTTPIVEGHRGLRLIR